MKNGSDCNVLNELKKAVNVTVRKSKIIKCVNATSRINKKAIQSLSKKQMEEAYVVWDHDTQIALDEILSNVKHTESDLIVCPKDWNHGCNETAHLWINVIIEDKHVALLMRQNCKNPQLAIDVDSEMRSKSCVNAFKNLGGGVSYGYIDGSLQTAIRIPYAHTLLARSIGE